MNWLADMGLLIVADDLSGAADCAAGFASKRITEVWLHGSMELPVGGVTAIDLNSRQMSSDSAAACHQNLRDQRGFGDLALYKKIDSTLRGNFAREIAALHCVGTLAIVAPAFPAMGRTTVGGVQLLDGVPVDRTAVWLNERLLGSANLVQELRNSGLDCKGVNVSTLRDPTALQALLMAGRAGAIQALVFDAEQESDLQILARSTAALAGQVFWAGSAGLARHLADLLPSQSLTRAVTPCRSVLTVVGSMSERSLQQAEQLVGNAEVQMIVLEPRKFMASDSSGYRLQVARRLSVLLQNNQHALVRFEQKGRDFTQARALTEQLGQWLVPLLPLADGLIATGGETARTILQQAGIERCQVQREIAPGVVLTHGRHGQRQLPVVTKAGAFGSATSLLDAWTQLCDPTRIDPLWPSMQKEQSHA